MTAAATATPSPVPPTATATATRPLATPTPTLAPTSTPTATPTPGAGAGQLVTNGDRAGRAVALTFDMGGRVDPALDIMQWLIAHRVKATVFMTGAMADNVNTDAGRQVLRLVDANRTLFALGNHSYSHPDFRDLTTAQMADELARTETSIALYTPRSPRPLFRPPYGGQDARVVAAVAAAGYAYTVMWDVDTIDWELEADGGPTADDIVAKVLGNARGGSIVLMHLGGYNTYEALPRVVEGLRARGLEPVTLAELLGLPIP